MRVNAVSIKELFKTNKKIFNSRGYNCLIHIVDFERGRADDSIRYVFMLEGLESWSDPNGHIVTLKFDKETATAPLKSRPFNDDCHVHCQCKSFQYWGPAYNSTQGNYNLFTVENRPPDVRDPGREIKICKHIARIAIMLEKMSWNALNKKSGITAASLEKVVSRDFDVIPIEETFPSLMVYLESFNKEVNPVAFCNNLTRSNYESELLRVGAII